MQIYALGNQQFMIVDTIDDFDWERDMERLAGLPQTGRMGSLCQQIPGLLTWKQIHPEMAADAADFWFGEVNNRN